MFVESEILSSPRVCRAHMFVESEILSSPRVRRTHMFVESEVLRQLNPILRSSPLPTPMLNSVRPLPSPPTLALRTSFARLPHTTAPESQSAPGSSYPV